MEWEKESCQHKIPHAPIIKGSAPNDSTCIAQSTINLKSSKPYNAFDFICLKTM